MIRGLLSPSPSVDQGTETAIPPQESEADQGEGQRRCRICLVWPAQAGSSQAI